MTEHSLRKRYLSLQIPSTDNYHHQSKKKRREKKESILSVIIKCVISLLLIISASSTLLKAVGRNEGNPKKQLLKQFKLDNKEFIDAYSIRSILKIASASDDGNATINEKESYNRWSSSTKAFLQIADQTRQDFKSLFAYNEEVLARGILKHGLSNFHEDAKHYGNLDDLPKALVSTAKRILKARDEGRPFKMAFGGYSVTTGRGNYFKESYPFVMERILSKPMDILGITLEVKNSAIGGVPSFPYGWCLMNFFGDADVVTWDYSMNEPNGVPEGMEAYIRHVLSMKQMPMFLAKDTHMAVKRKDVLQSYVNMDVMLDPIVVHTDPATDPFLILEEASRPIGFQEWRKFGAPPGAPGKSKHHPAKKEHEFIGWLIAMHFLCVLELVHEFDVEAKNRLILEKRIALIQENSFELPAPLSTQSIITPSKYFEPMSPSLYSILYGTQLKTNMDPYKRGWKINPISCRTMYQPVLTGKIGDIIISGAIDEEVSMMSPNRVMLYNKGWMLDIGEDEKKAKKKLNRFGDLGFLDEKNAYYGVLASGPLTLFLPYEPLKQVTRHEIDEGIDTNKWFQSVILCEVNENRQAGECNIEKDIRYIVGGVQANNIKYIEAEGVTYRGKKICIIIDVPKESQVTNKAGMTNTSSILSESELGLSLEISVTNMHVTLKKGACSIAHVIWENKIPVNQE